MPCFRGPWRLRVDLSIVGGRESMPPLGMPALAQLLGEAVHETVHIYEGRPERGAPNRAARPRDPGIWNDRIHADRPRRETRRASADNLNQLLADTITLRDLYKKHHWQVSGPTFYQLHLLFDKHFNEQNELVDLIAERIMMLGGVSVAMSADVAEMTLIPRPPKGREEVPVQISRLLHAHEIVLEEARAMARKAAEEGDDGTNDLLVSNVIRTNEMQVWFVAEHVVDGPLVHADGRAATP